MNKEEIEEELTLEEELPKQIDNILSYHSHHLYDYGRGDIFGIPDEVLDYVAVNIFKFMMENYNISKKE